VNVCVWKVVHSMIVPSQQHYCLVPGGLQGSAILASCTPSLDPTSPAGPRSHKRDGGTGAVALLLAWVPNLDFSTSSTSVQVPEPFQIS
jgi:hypothetical protein